MDHTSSLSRLLKEQEVAEILNMEVSTLRRWRWAGEGPRFIKIGAAVRYDPQVLNDYLAERVRTSTSDVGSHSATA
jgi:predicted DNA-binding transcriptional regulator AlpA